MPKLSRRKRRLKEKLETEKAARREIEKVRAGVPYSRHKVRVCEHFWTYGYRMIGGVRAVSLLQPVSETECVCRGCGKRFPTEKYKIMEQWTEEYVGTDCIFGDEFRFIHDSVKPVYFYYSAPNEITYVKDTDSADGIQSED